MQQRNNDNRNIYTDVLGSYFHVESDSSIKTYVRSNSGESEKSSVELTTTIDRMTSHTTNVMLVAITDRFRLKCCSILHHIRILNIVVINSS